MDFRLRNNDLEITNGDIELCHSYVEFTAQSIAIHLKTLAGEWFLDENLGLPYLSHILGKKRNDQFLMKLLNKKIGRVADVTKLSNFSFSENTDKRSLAIKFMATLSDTSTITINESIGV